MHALRAVFVHALVHCMSGVTSGETQVELPPDGLYRFAHAEAFGGRPGRGTESLIQRGALFLACLQSLLPPSNCVDLRFYCSTGGTSHYVRRTSGTCPCLPWVPVSPFSAFPSCLTPAGVCVLCIGLGRQLRRRSVLRCRCSLGWQHLGQRRTVGERPPQRRGALHQRSQRRTPTHPPTHPLLRAPRSTSDRAPPTESGTMAARISDAWTRC